ncbi:ABC transporter ATP-binding protein [Leucobacter sp. M11]|uniref:ABC transporter ATP-binding protein n=1 Tax=Leucobacter sp. M11 TaxID=2993565 RepID=UPI002D80C815|nr:ATP-binding cassette domain-containing protein [Leucobacter sp. M11]MEB4615068.1 ATP-binding cassette domain-containing protein [Leucobacter sp. M11]
MPQHRPTTHPGSGPETPVIEALHVSRTFRLGRGRDVRALVDVSVTVAPGTCLAVVGESGSGKTTLARAIVGLERFDEGEIMLAGEPVRSRQRRTELRRRSRHIQMVFQDPNGSLNRRLPVRVAVEEVLEVHLGLRGDAARQRSGELFDTVGLGREHLDALPSQLSGGQRQRVAIARALAAEPAVIVLDEAVSALDVTVQAQILDMLDRLRQERGVAYLFITHDLSVVRQIADDVVVMRRGEIVERGSVGDVLDRPQHPYTRLLLDSAPRPGWVPRRRLNTKEDTA